MFKTESMKPFGYRVLMVIFLTIIHVSLSQSIWWTLYIIPSTVACGVMGNSLAKQKLRDKLIHTTLACSLNILGVIILMSFPKNREFVSILKFSPEEWETVCVRFHDGNEGELTYINDEEGFDPWSEPLHQLVTEWKRIEE